MKTVDEMEREINDIIDDLSDRLFNMMDTEANRAIRTVEDSRKEVNSILLEYANQDGTVSQSRLRRLLRELDALENDIIGGLTDDIDEGLGKIIDTTDKYLVSALTTIIGLTLLSQFDSDKLERDITDEVKKIMYERKFKGVTLEQRIRAMSGVIRDTIQQSIRYGVNVGETVTVISRRVKKEVDKIKWQINRIIKSELPTAFRVSIATIGNKTGAIKAVRIIDNRGRHKYHETHECYRLAEQNMYGMGKGVYLPTDTFIFDPHPQCSAYYRFILREDLTKGGD